MQTKAEALRLLKDEFQQWEDLIARNQADQSASRRVTEPLALKETLIHLWAWQQHTIAYLEAASQGKEPVLPPWPFEITGDDEGDVDATNAWIAQTYYAKPWEVAYQDWQDGFLRLLALAERLPEPDLLDGDKYPWRHGWPLLASLEGTYEHHREHREALLP
jgi:hypothetical protein